MMERNEKYTKTMRGKGGVGSNEEIEVTEKEVRILNGVMCEGNLAEDSLLGDRVPDISHWISVHLAPLMPRNSSTQHK